MKISEKNGKIIFITAAAVLTAALVCVSVLLAVLNGKYKAVQGKIDDCTAQLEAELAKNGESTDKINELESQLDEAKKANEAASEAVDAQKEEISRIEKEKNEAVARLEKEKAVLQAQLTAKKKAQQEELKRLAVQNSQQSAAPEGAKICYLTFDDGPSDNTLRILDILAGYNIKASFFVVGTGKLEYLNRIKAEGHTVGLHSMTHNYSKIYSSVDAYLADLNSLSDAVQSITGEKSMIMRFPGGGSNAVSKKYCSGIMSDLTVRLPSMGYSYFDWNVSSGDAASVKPSAQTIINNVLTQAQGKNSICVLMHDTSVKTTTVDALPSIISGLYDQGYRFEPLTAATYGYHQRVGN